MSPFVVRRCDVFADRCVHPRRSSVSSCDAGQRRRHLGANVPFGTANFVVAVTTTFVANGKVDTRLLDTVALSHLRPYRCSGSF